jgi:hypothetical protein
VKRTGRAHAFALLAAFVCIVVISALWIVNLKMGPPLEAWTGGATVIFVPLVLIILTAGWLVIRGVLHGRVHWRALTVLAVTAIASLVIVVVTCGPTQCFLPSRSNYFMGWFVVIGVALTALVHHLVLDAFPPEPGEAG